MPYKSDKQRRYMHAVHPEIASKWDKEYGGKIKAKKKKIKKGVYSKLPRFGVAAENLAKPNATAPIKGVKSIKVEAPKPQTPVNAPPDQIKPWPGGVKRKWSEISGKEKALLATGAGVGTGYGVARHRSKKELVKNMDPFELSKKKDHKSKGNPSTGRAVTSALFPGIHGAVAGRKGHKVDAAGNELVGSIAGGTVGQMAAIPFGPAAMGVGGVAGNITGNTLGTRRANRMGYYKAQKKDVKKSMDPFSIEKAEGLGYLGDLAAHGRKMKTLKNIQNSKATMPVGSKVVKPLAPKPVAKNADPFGISKAGLKPVLPPMLARPAMKPASTGEKIKGLGSSLGQKTGFSSLTRNQKIGTGAAGVGLYGIGRHQGKNSY